MEFSAECCDVSFVVVVFFQITTAIKFLNNPNVLRSAVGQKQAFLRSKGLTEDEIQLACERAGVFSREPVQQNHQTVISMDVGTGGGGGGVAKASYSVQPQSWFGRVREVLNSVAVISGLMYGVYMFYKVSRKAFDARKALWFYWWWIS